MEEKYDVAVKVISQKGVCPAGHKVGEEWVLSQNSPEGLCLSALNSIYTSFRVLMFGGSMPWQTDPDVVEEICPDIKNPVIFELRRLRK